MLGAALVAVVLFIFLYNIRTALISLTAIPLSLLIAVDRPELHGDFAQHPDPGRPRHRHRRSGGRRHHRCRKHLPPHARKQALPNPLPVHRVVLDASLEVRGAVVYATFVVAMVFLPVRSMSGVQGRLFGPLAVAYILAIMASLLVALTVTPALSALLTPESCRAIRTAVSSRWMKRHYAALMERLMLRPVAGHRSRRVPVHRGRLRPAVFRQRIPARSQGRPLHRSHVRSAGNLRERNSPARPRAHSRIQEAPVRGLHHGSDRPRRAGRRYLGRQLRRSPRGTQAARRRRGRGRRNTTPRVAGKIPRRLLRHPSFSLPSESKRRSPVPPRMSR